ncbi:unknown protein [Synechocystis sp. LKSZ1]
MQNNRQSVDRSQFQNRSSSSFDRSNRGQFQNNRQSVDRSQFQNDRTQRQDNRQTTWQDRSSDRTQRQDNRQENRTDRTNIRQDNRTNRSTNRQDQITNRQNNRQNFVNDNYGYWRGGGWYGGGYYAPPGWGWVGLTTGLVIGSAIASPPPYYDTVYIGSTSYMYSDGVYLQPSGNEYTIVAPPPGAIVTYLPDGCTTFSSNGVQYYDCSGIYYQPFFQNGSMVYQVVQL